jgi:hypothetical protein
MSRWRIVAITETGERRETEWNSCADINNQQAVLQANRARLPREKVEIEFEDEIWPEFLELEP